MSEYEVWCHHCDVTFPVKTRRCLHCGAPTSPSRLQQSMRELPGLALREGSAPSSADPPFASLPESLAQSAVDGPVEPEEPGKRSLLRAGMSVVWMILLAGGYLWKSCTQ